MEGLSENGAFDSESIRQGKREVEKACNEVRRELAALFSKVSVIPDEASEGIIGFENWELSTLRETPRWTAFAFRAEGATPWRAFDRDLTIAPSTGHITIEYEEEDEVLATPKDPAIVRAQERARYWPMQDTRGVLLFIPPLPTVNGHHDRQPERP